MVKIINLEEVILNEEDVGEDDTTEEEDDGIEADMDENPNEIPNPPNSVATPEVPSVPEALEAAASPSLALQSFQQRALDPGFFPPSLDDGFTRYLRSVMAQYGQYIVFQRSMHAREPIRPPGPDDLRRQALELQLSRLPNGHSNLQFECSITAPDTSNTREPPTETNVEVNRDTECETDVPATKTAPDTSEKDKEEEKLESDVSTKEKSNTLSENEQLPATGTKEDLLFSLELSVDCGLSEISHCQVPPNYDTSQATNTSNKETEYRATVKESCLKNLDPELKDPMHRKEPSEATEEGEAASLPAHSVVKDCWEQWVDDDRLFNLAEDVAPSTSKGFRTSSPPSPTTERRRVKFENRQRALERVRAERTRPARPIERRIFVPTQKVGHILGKGGRRIREIEQKSGANIKVEHRRSNKPVTQLIITGTDEQISIADEEICIIVRNFKPPKSGKATTASVSKKEELEDSDVEE